VVGIFWEIVISSSGVIAGFFIGEFLLKKLGFGNGMIKTEIKLSELQEFLKKRFLVNSALVHKGRRTLVGLEEVELDEAMKLFESLKSDEAILFNRDDCRFFLKRGETFIYLRGKIASFRDLAEIWEVVQRSLRGEAK